MYRTDYLLCPLYLSFHLFAFQGSRLDYKIHRDMEIVTIAKQVLKIKTMIKSTIVTGIRSSTVLVVQQ